MSRFPFSDSRRPRGFSLIELLLVIAILGILAALLFPALDEAVAAVQTLRCKNHLRDIGVAYSRYVADSGGVWPPLLTHEAPAALLQRMADATGLAAAPLRPAADWGQPGPHWSIVLWPYLGSLDVYTCPADPKAGLCGADVVKPERAHSVAFLNAPPESYALNVILFRTADDMRRQAGCTWGLDGDADYNGLAGCTTTAEQRRQFPQWPHVILFFCGASGQTVGSQFNVPFRTTGLVERWEWHPHAASAPFADEPACGANYLYADGRVEYREALPPPVEWGYVLPQPPKPVGPPAPIASSSSDRP